MSKVARFICFLEDHEIELAFISETWLADASNPSTATLKDSGFSIIHSYRSDKQGGGTAIIHKTGLSISNCTFASEVTTFEYICTLIKQNNHLPVLAVSIYRPGSQHLTPQFFNELNNFLGIVSSKHDSIILCGDLNVHFENVGDKQVIECNTILQSYGFINHVNQPTHILGGTLDQICTMGVSVSSTVVDKSDSIGSDHYPILSRINLSPKLKSKKEISFRNIKKMDFITFNNRLADNVSHLLEQVTCFHDGVKEIGSICTDLLDEFAPVVKKTVTTVKHAPWFDSEYRQWRTKRRKAERKWKQSMKKNGVCHETDELKIVYKDLTDKCVALADHKKKKYITNLIDNSGNKPKTLFEMVNKALDRKQDSSLPDLSESIPDVATLAKEFNQYFIEKIQKIRSSIAPDSSFTPSSQPNDTSCPIEPSYPSGPSSPPSGPSFPSLPSYPSGPSSPPSGPSFPSLPSYPSGSSSPPNGPSTKILDSFRPATLEEIDEIITESGLDCSPSDILPTTLLKDNISILKEFILKLVNLSLADGDFEGVKLADIIPIIKGSTLDNNILKNYRPVSNLSFLGKLIERVVLRRLNEHLKINNLEIPEQSAYKKNFSTETVLVRLTNDALIASDNKTATILMLLDLSAAFDTVDHSLLLNILRKEIGITGTALRWFRSFLTGRSQRIRLGDTLSDAIIIKFGVPQGSVLGPILFNIYIRSLYGVIKKLGFSVLGYADDHQIYHSFKHFNQADVITNKLVTCFKRVQEWMKSVYLQLNSGKTEIIVIGPPNVLNNITIGGVFLTPTTCIRFVSTAKNLGFLIDSHLTFHKQVIAVKKKSFLTLRNIRRIRKLMSEDQLKTVTNALTVSCLDYCNALYFGINRSDIRHLQIVQNMAAKCVTGKRKYDHVDNDLVDLHWLTIDKRIIFKIALLVFKALMGLAPTYIQELISYKSVGRTCTLYTPKVNTMFGKRAFSSMGPRVWNKLPSFVTDCDNIGRFKRMLKTFLFNLSEFEVGNMGF